jgi:Fur family zinc uptake transcriptional regulator
MSAKTAKGQVWLRKVEALCSEKRVQFTPLRRDVAALLAESGKPAGAYELMEMLAKRQGRPVAPPTVYRALDFLVEHGFVVKIESRQTYMICDDPGHDHHGILLICSECGQSAEIDNPDVDKVLTATASASHFHLQRQMVEIEGLCRACHKEAQVASKSA